MKPLLLLALTTTLAFSQGPLLPLSAPAPSMKSLDQIEPRTAIPRSPTTPIAGPHFTISQPGSYYLTGNIEVASGNGINITTSNVTLDLNGFSLISKTASPAAGNAIDLAASLNHVQMKNGSITGGTVRTSSGPQVWQATFVKKGWEFGIRDDSATPAQGVLLSHLTLEKCGDSGIFLSGSSAMEHLTATANAGNGIFAFQSAITQTTASLNGYVGIFDYQGSVLNSTANGNYYTGIDASNSTVNSVTSNQNGSTGIYSSYGPITHASSNNNGGDGIYTYQGSVTHSTAVSNGGNGITAYQGSVAEVIASYNSAAGISAVGGTVSHCRATLNSTTGIFVGTGVVDHCVAASNSTSLTTVDKEIDVSATGQRDACVPASE